MPDLLLLLSFLCIVYHGLQVFSNRNKSRLMLLIIVTGLMSNVVLGFSPTIGHLACEFPILQIWHLG